MAQQPREVIFVMLTMFMQGICNFWSGINYRAELREQARQNKRRNKRA